MPVSVLTDRSQILDAARRLAARRLAPHRHPAKNWDGAHMVERIVAELGDRRREAAILDVGCQWCPMLRWLASLGFRRLYGIDAMAVEPWWTRVSERLRGWRIDRSVQDLQQTTFPDATVSAVTSLSVIEHGVDPDRYAVEMARIIRPGGLLLTSTDYWPDGVDTSGIYPYGPQFGEMRVFDRTGLETLLATLDRRGFELGNDVSLEAAEPLVTWRGRSYTFVLIEARRR